MITKDKIYLTAIIILLVLLGGLFFLRKSELSDRDSEISKLKNKEKLELRKVRDSVSLEIDTLISKHKKSKDSLLLINPKFIPYEKLIYIDIEYDSAYDVLSRAKYKKGEKPNNNPF